MLNQDDRNDRIREILADTQQKSNAIGRFQRAMRTALQTPIVLTVIEDLIDNMQKQGTVKYLGIDLAEVRDLLSWGGGNDG